LNIIKTIPSSQLVYLDESGIEDNATSWYGWSLRGTRCYGQKVYQHTHRISMIAGLCNNSLIAPFVFEGYCNKEIFEAYVEQVLIRELTEGQTVILDNINFHRSPIVKQLIESKGCKLLFIPTYSPDLNKIEHHWFKIKHRIRKIAHSFDLFFDAVSHAFVMSDPY